MDILLQNYQDKQEFCFDHSLLFNSVSAASQIAYALQAFWDGCNAITLETEQFDFDEEDPAFQTAVSLAKAEYCFEGETCAYRRVIIPEPSGENPQVQWQPWNRETLRENILAPDNFVLFVLDEWQLMQTERSQYKRVFLEHYRLKWQQVKERKALFLLFKMHPELNLEIGANGVQDRSLPALGSGE